MRMPDAWTAFLLMLFAVVGLCGLFSSYATSLPWERGMARSVLLDDVLAAGTAPDAAQRMEALRPQLGSLASEVLDAPGTLSARVAEARRTIIEEQRRESGSIDFRVRLMLGVVTLIAAGMGAGIMALARRMTFQAAEQAHQPHDALSLNRD